MRNRRLLATWFVFAGLSACQNKHAGIQVSLEDCYSCHQPEYATTSNPPHASAGFSTDCSVCHITSAWVPAYFSHPYQLTGAHTTATCVKCHGDPPVYAGTPTQCYGCHADDFTRAVGLHPLHTDFPHTCQDCHTTVAWLPATPSPHPFPLEGKHALITCEACHGDFSVLPPTTCYGCHQADYERSPYPNHQSFAHTCDDCHTLNAWVPATSGSHPENRFPISTSGKHRNITCIQCHSNPGSYADGANTNCVGCHTGEHSRASMDRIDSHQQRVGSGPSDYPAGAAPGNFCLRCHPDGKT